MEDNSIPNMEEVLKRTDSEQANRTTTTTPKPYTEFNHPYKSFLDIIISFIFPYLIPLANVATHSITATSATTMACLKRLRDRLEYFDSFSLNDLLPKWQTGAACDILQCRMMVTRDATILSQWGIIPAQDTLLQQVIANDKKDIDGNSNNSTVELIVKLPLDLIPPDKRTSTTITAPTKGLCTMLDPSSIDLSIIPINVPIIIWFHGGGQVLGRDGNDALQMDCVMNLLKAQHDKTKSTTFPQVVIISVSYRLAPEHVFPAAQIDTLCALEYVLTNTVSLHNNIHIAGCSAGGLFATVACMEARRRYPERIKSCFLFCPMLNPKADSLSYYMNSKSDGCCPVTFLRWSWRATLELPKSMDTTCDDNFKGSNRTTWEMSPWNQTKEWARLAHPVMNDIPKEELPQFVIGACKADPLHDDAVELVDVLHRVVFKESLGNHVVGWATHPESRKELDESWRAAVFD